MSDRHYRPDGPVKSLDVSVIARVHLTAPLSNVRHNIKHYEEMHEYDITPESREVTLKSLREQEAILVEAIRLLNATEP